MLNLLKFCEETKLNIFNFYHFSMAQVVKILANGKQGVAYPIRKSRDYVYGIWQCKGIGVEKLFQNKIIWEEK